MLYLFSRKLQSRIRGLFLSIFCSYALFDFKCSISYGITIINPWRFRFGLNFCALDNLYIYISSISDNDPTVSIGDNVYIGKNCHINIHSRLFIGDNVKIADNVYIADTTHDPYSETKNIISYDGVQIGSNVWIGSNVLIIGHCRIGDNVTIGAGSVVSYDIPSNVIVRPNRQLVQIPI